MVCKLKVPALTAELGTDQDARSISFREPRCVAVPLHERKTFMKNGDLHILDALSQRCIDGRNPCLRAAYQENFFWIDPKKKTRKPVEHRMSCGLRLLGRKVRKSTRKPRLLRTRGPESHAGGSVAGE